MRRLDAALAVVVLLIVTTWMANPAMSQFFPPIPPPVSVSPDNINFEDVPVGETESVFLTVTNNWFLGRNISTNIVDTVLPDNSSEYAITPSVSEIGPFGSLELTITYTPSAVGSSSVKLSVIATPLGNLILSSGGIATEVQVTGNGIGAGPTAVEIDIRPGSGSNPINLKSKGVIPVAILTTDTFDATEVNPGSVEFGPNGAGECHGKGHIVDVDGDGDDDMLLHFKVQETGIAAGDTAATLIGETNDGDAIYGSDTLTIKEK